MDITSHCISCRSKTLKHEKTTDGRQRYRCGNCNRSFLLEYRYNACRASTDRHLQDLLVEGCGIRSIARLLKISITTVLRRIRRIAAAIRKPAIAFGKEYELDEMRTYVKKKSRLFWIAYAIRKDTGEVVDFIVGGRTQQTLKLVTDTLLLSNASRIYTDKLHNYSWLISRNIHCTKRNGTNKIERKNLTLRTHLKRLSRRTICFSKSKAMLEACLRIYFWGNLAAAARCN